MRYGFVAAKGENLVYGRVEGDNLSSIGFYFSEDALGDLYRVHGGSLMPQIKGRFCDLPDGSQGFLPDMENISPQENRIVQLTHSPANGKVAKLTARPEISGELFSLYLTPGRLHFPKKMEKDVRDRIQNALADQKGAFGGQVRSLAGQASESELKEAWHDLQSLAQKAAQAVHFDPTPARVHRAGFAFYKWAKELQVAGVCEIRINDPELARAWKKQYPLSAKAFDFKEISDPLAYDPIIRKGIQVALERRVETGEGVRLRFDALETLTVVDVDSAAIKGQTRLALNLQAADSICDQLALRNIGGMVVVDFISLKDSGEQKMVTQRMTKRLKEKDLGARVYGFSSMGLFELTLARKGDPLSLSYERFINQ